MQVYVLSHPLVKLWLALTRTRAAGRSAQGAQGSIVTCAYHRDRSATNEAVEVTSHGARARCSGRPYASGLPQPDQCAPLSSLCVALLTWQAAHIADPDLPAPPAVAAKLIHDVSSRLQHPFRQAQRITPVDGMCSAQKAPIRALVSRLAHSYASLRELPQAEHAEHEPSRHEQKTGAPLKFAVAFKSRSGKQEGQQVQNGTALATTPAPAGGLTLPGAAEGCQSVRGNSVAEDACTTAKDCSRCAGQPAADAAAGSKERYASRVNAPIDSSAKAGLASEESQGAGVCISREVAVAAAAKGFSRACGDEGLMAEVDLEQPQAVICLEVLPVDASTIAAVSIVDRNACVLRPRLVLKPLQVCQ
ncbi:hypothetical protein CVIRNUC_008317 [Coccomyxa viridis]|uniref:Uracil phosphoribosyltransferase n=1 Tax=Coccomyxa viridis TaxID=1274662 RepID=A0AAV1IE82_9CHLO|nr:hypothetical protein CVIRNUC_008317 [Coccomyxa viridis]